MSAVNPGLAAGGIQDTLRTRWAALAPRERWMVRGAVAALLLLLLWSLAVQPALRILRSTPAQLDALDTQALAMQRLASEARELRSIPAMSTAQASIALKAASDRLGDKAKLTLQGDRAVLTVTGVSPQALREWLQEVRAAARARPLEATLTRAPQGFNGSVVLATGGTP
jgi:general secretion pathway protein M